MNSKLRLPCFLSILIVFLSGCTDPIEPEFEFQEGLVFVEGFATTTPGNSYVIISTSAIEFGVYVVNFLEGASVTFENVGTGSVVALNEIEGTYVAPQDFRVAPGEQWKLNITLPNGKRYESSVENVLQPIPVSDLEVRYDTELEFRETLGGRFLPGHELLVSFDDPVGEENYYYWSYRTYENLDFCEKCFQGIFREGECQSLGSNFAGFPYFDYACETDCWQIRFPESITVYSDRFTDGKAVNKLPIGNLLLYTKQNMVVEVQQMAISPDAFEYYQVLRDVLENSTGLNAPPPAALVGNMSNPEDSEEFVFGRFTAVGASATGLFIDRTFIGEQALEQRQTIIFEPVVGCPLPPDCTTFAPCSETRFRTAIRPELWVDQ